MPAIKSTIRRLAVLGGVSLALTTAAISFAACADSAVRTIKIATAAESKPLSWGPSVRNLRAMSRTC